MLSQDTDTLPRLAACAAVQDRSRLRRSMACAMPSGGLCAGRYRALAVREHRVFKAIRGARASGSASDGVQHVLGLMDDVANVQMLHGCSRTVCSPF